jgi:hypothetical protein
MIYGRFEVARKLGPQKGVSLLACNLSKQKTKKKQDAFA